MTRNIEQGFWRPACAPWLELRFTHQSSQAYKPHHHSQLSVGAIVEGETFTFCREQTFHLHEGDMVVIAPKEVHSCNPAPEIPRSYYMLWLDVPWCLEQLGLPSDAALACEQTAFHDPHLFAMFMDIVRLVQNEQEAALRHAVRALLTMLPGVKRATSDDEPFKEMQSVLLAGFNGLLRLDTLAGRYAVPKETLIRQFKRATGLTPGAWFNNARVEFAKAQLRAGADITDTGYLSGFADQSHFHRTFVRFTASTPRQYARIRSISDNK